MTSKHTKLLKLTNGSISIRQQPELFVSIRFTFCTCIFSVLVSVCFGTPTLALEDQENAEKKTEEVSDAPKEVDKSPEEKEREAKLAEATKRFDEKIRPWLAKYCYECHSSDDPQGSLDLAKIMNYSQAQENEQVWAGVLERVQADEMPPKSATPMDFEARQEIIRWSRKHQPQQVDCTKLASDRTVNFYLGSVMSRRLNRAEYNNTLSDLFGLEITVGSRLPADGAGGGGFDTTGDTLFTSSLSIEKFIEAADEVMYRILPDALSTQDEAYKLARERLLALGNTLQPQSEQSTQVDNDSSRAKRILQRFLRKAFRRPVTDEDVLRYTKIFEHASLRGDSFDASLRLAMTGILISPHFLFLVEPEPNEGDIQPLGPYPLASRLSYFLWSSMPDEALLVAAESGRLTTPDGYKEQIQRMLKDSRAQSLGNRFAVQWLEIDKLGTEIRPDRTKFPEFTEELAASMKQEVIQYFNHLIDEDRSLLNLIDSDYSFWDSRLEDLYNSTIQNNSTQAEQSQEAQPAEASPTSDGFHRVHFTDRSRGGLIGMAAVHSLTSYPLRTSPVLRGRYVLEILLGERVPPPPPNVPPLAADDHQVDATTMREQMERHRKDPTCASCHQRMDPLGFSLESFDNLGRIRSESNGQKIDVSAQLPDGFSFEGSTGLKQVLMDRKQQIMRNLTKKMVGYALGRELNRFDDCVINDSIAALEANDYKPSVLIETIATSLPFRSRYYAK